MNKIGRMIEKFTMSTEDKILKLYNLDKELERLSNYRSTLVEDHNRIKKAAEDALNVNDNEFAEKSINQSYNTYFSNFLSEIEEIKKSYNEVEKEKTEFLKANDGLDKLKENPNSETKVEPVKEQGQIEIQKEDILPDDSKNPKKKSFRGRRKYIIFYQKPNSLSN